MDKKKSLTTGEVAKLCDVSIPTIHKWIREDRIKHFKMPGSGKIRIPRDAIYQFMKSHGFPTDEEQNTMNILLICGEEHYNKKFANAICKSDVYQCNIANDVFAAGMIATQESPDIIFVDLSLTGVDNKNFCSSIRGTVNNFALLIVAISGAFSGSQKKKLTQYGFNEFLELPLKATSFKKKISSLLKKN
ncbi:helix-turn-helix domain-containing protein [Candidatus Uabimicrobium sp. HlEnr_7]|uniref:helix-turn-helix domain-containing protein n=1 Tax=Candidatus Uabimicrobium helgolandensis TaxID=3095367 RepID=UPI003556CCA2